MSYKTILVFCLFCMIPARVAAQPAVRLVEAPTTSGAWRIESRSELSGTLKVPGPDGQGKILVVRGTSAISYDERILALDAKGAAERVVRAYRKAELKRTLGDQAQEGGIRPEVRRIVLLRRDTVEVPFSPEAPLTRGEIELVRTDVFAPALNGLLAGRDASIGQSWSADAGVVRELTDMIVVREGGITCRLAEVQEIDLRQVARVTFQGVVSGANEDGPCRQEIEGFLYFDIARGAIAYLSLRGKHVLPGPNGTDGGTLDGRFVLTRAPIEPPPALADAGLAGVRLIPDDDNTLLLEELGPLKLEYPRRWKIAQARQDQITLDGADGSGVLVSLTPPGRGPTPAAYLEETRGWLAKNEGTATRLDPPREVEPGLFTFVIESTLKGKPAILEYFVRTSADGTVLVAGRLNPGDATARADLARLARRTRLARLVPVP